jgi:hypothetical protein
MTSYRNSSHAPRPAAVVPARVRRPSKHARLGIIDRNDTAAPPGRRLAVLRLQRRCSGPAYCERSWSACPRSPRLARNDQPAAAGARHATRRNPWLPHAPQTLMGRAVATFNGLLRSHYASSSKSGRNGDPAGRGFDSSANTPGLAAATRVHPASRACSIRRSRPTAAGINAFSFTNGSGGRGRMG